MGTEGKSKNLIVKMKWKLILTGNVFNASQVARTYQFAWFVYLKWPQMTSGGGGWESPGELNAHIQNNKVLMDQLPGDTTMSKGLSEKVGK
jgi:hypothetical protein